MRKARTNNLGRRTFGKDTQGVAALEFALVGPLFLALTFAIFEASYYFFTVSAVHAAGENASRLIRTGQVQNGVSQDDFFDEICNVTKAIGNCKESLTVEVNRYDSFGELAADDTDATCVNADEDALDNISFDAGSRRDIVRVRICYLYRSVSPGIGIELGSTDDGRRPIVSTLVFRNEPFEVTP